MKQKTVAILGSGSMGTAILAGMLKNGINKEAVRITTKTSASAEKLADQFGVNTFSTDREPNANCLAVEGADIILVAVKPGYVLEVLKEIRAFVSEGALVISVAAGVEIQTMEGNLPDSVAVIRAMPNTPALIGMGLTGLAAGSSVSAEELALAVSLFDAVGKTMVIPESQIDALSTISGSGPAYVFYFIEEFIKTAVSHGFSEEDAYLLVSQTFLGASELLVQSQGDPADLRRQVTSPNGTTMKAVAVLEEGNLNDLFFKATSAALARAKEIAQEHRQ
jgi:pyrroline-5-carboxylate reductase